MKVEFVSGDVWPAITKAARTGGPRSAAIAYVGANAPELLPLKAGDVLVCDASDPVLLGHGTSPEALAAFMKRGVQVSSCPGLHAKVLVTASRTVVGSANASYNSTNLEEAVLVTDDAVMHKAARSFIAGLPFTTHVDELFIEAARATWAMGRSSPLGRAGAPRAANPLLPESFRLYLAKAYTYAPTKTETEAYRRMVRRTRRSSGPASTYSLDSYRVAADDSLRRDNVLIIVGDEGSGAMVWPPVVVISEPVTFGPGRVHITRGLAALEPIPVAEARDRLLAKGLDARLGKERWIRSKPVRDALVGLWGLGPNPDKNAVPVL